MLSKNLWMGTYDVSSKNFPTESQEPASTMPTTSYRGFRKFNSTSAPGDGDRASLMKRCQWAKTALSVAYHDQEWGVPQHDDRILFEFLVLEGAQAGLSWETILRKRDNYRRAFAHFDPELVAHYDAGTVEELLADPGIVRNRLKIMAAVTNARAFLAIQEEFGSFDAYVWRFVNGRPIRNTRRSGEVPTHTIESDAMSKDLTLRGFKFVGTTICYAFMQAVGMVNDHEKGCFRYGRTL